MISKLLVVLCVVLTTLVAGSAAADADMQDREARNAVAAEWGSRFAIPVLPETTDPSSSKLLTKWIADGKIMATPAGYSYAGHKIADMATGWVLVKNPGDREPTAKPSPQSELKSTDIPPYQTFLRQASAKIPRLYAPEAIAWGTAY